MRTTRRRLLLIGTAALFAVACVPAQSVPAPPLPPTEVPWKRKAVNTYAELQAALAEGWQMERTERQGTGSNREVLIYFLKRDPSLPESTATPSPACKSNRNAAVAGEFADIVRYDWGKTPTASGAYMDAVVNGQVRNNCDTRQTIEIVYTFYDGTGASVEATRTQLVGVMAPYEVKAFQIREDYLERRVMRVEVAARPRAQ